MKVASSVIGLYQVATSLIVVYVKTQNALQGPYDLFSLYGIPGIFVWLFGNRTTWRLEAQVLGDLKDEDAKAFKDSIIAECTTIAVAAAIVAQISITGLSLNNLSQTHWVAQGCLVLSLTTSLMAVYYSSTQSRILGRLLHPKQVRTWIRGSILLKNPSRLINRFELGRRRQDSLSRAALRSNPAAFKVRGKASHDGASILEALIRQCFMPSPSSVITVSAPQMLLSTSLFALFIGLGVYFGISWTKNLDQDRGQKDSRNIFITYIIALVVSAFVYSLSRLFQDNDKYSSESVVIMDYLLNFGHKFAAPDTFDLKVWKEQDLDPEFLSIFDSELADSQAANSTPETSERVESQAGQKSNETTVLRSGTPDLEGQAHVE